MKLLNYSCYLGRLYVRHVKRSTVFTDMSVCVIIPVTEEKTETDRVNKNMASFFLPSFLSFEN